MFVIDDGFLPPNFNFNGTPILQNNGSPGLLVASLPAGITAAGAEVGDSNAGPFNLSVLVTAGGPPQLFSFNNLPGLPALSFIGFVSTDAPITQISFDSSNDFTTIDNFVFGQASPIPEPASLTVLGALAAGATGLRRRTKCAPAAA